MRAIPAALKAKLLDRFKAESLGNEPRVRVIAKQTTGHTLLTEPIHENIPAAFGDVAIRQLAGESEPSLAFAICVDNGIAEVYSRKLPSNLNAEWILHWKYRTAEDAAIEFNGSWQMDASKEWYYLQTERYPYLFTIESGELYVQHWTDETTRTHLASDVSNIAVCRGWQSTDDPTIDQGLIAGYIRDGKVYYRALCYQESGELLWETERAVTELGENNTSLCVFRTNDFRVGFLTEVLSGADTHMVLTGRSYAGQSVRPETAVGWAVGNSARIVATPILYKKGYDTEGYASGHPFDEGFYLGNFMTAQTCVPVSYERTSGTTFTITFDHNLWLRKPLEAYLTVTRASASGNIVGSVSVSGNTMYVTTSTEMPGTEQITVALLDHSNLLFYGTNTSPQPVSTFSLIMDATVYYLADDEYVTARPRNIVLTATPIEYPETSQKEEGAITYTVYNVTLTPTQVGDVPI